MTLSDSNGQWKEPRSTLLRGRLEGWAKVRIAGQTEWKRVWAVITAKTPPENEVRPTSPAASYKRNRMSSLFSSRAPSPPPPIVNPTSLVSLYMSPKPKDRKVPILTLGDVTQVFAVYPERPELISMSTLVKIQGKLGPQAAAYDMKGREGWLFVMPEFEAEKVPPMEMLKWVVGMCSILYISFSAILILFIQLCMIRLSCMGDLGGMNGILSTRSLRCLHIQQERTKM